MKSGPVNYARKACGCRDYTRSELVRTGIAQAGQGLPSVEPGTPAPAGTGLSRRSFLSRSAGLALTVYGAQAMLPRAFEDGISQAMAQGGGDDRILVSVFLDGGVDSLTLLAPTEDPRYAELRPTLAVPPGAGTVFTEDDRLRWHPNAGGLSTLHDEGKLSVIPAIGYDDPNQSHFTSRHYWEIGQLSPTGQIGWLGRYLDLHGSSDNPLQGLSLDSSLLPALASSDVPVATVPDPTDYDFWAPGVWGKVLDDMLNSFGAMAPVPEDDPAMAQARKAIGFTDKLRNQLGGFTLGGTEAPYPEDRFAERLAALAAMIDVGLPLSCVSLTAPGGYDTHADQAATLPGNIGVTSDSLLAFQRDLEARGIADRVVVHVWSEFGRRPKQNGTGTDHGAGGIGLLIGSSLRGKMIGEFPGLTQLDPDDNLRHVTDFRSIYSALLEQWLEVDAGPIIPGAAGFQQPQLLAPATPTA